MTLVSATTSNVRSTCGRLAALALVAVLAGLSAGCGGSDPSSSDSTAADTSIAGAVDKALREMGDTQGVSCESLGAVEVSGVSRKVARCSFSEEKNGSGEMRSRGGCFALEDGTVIDVTLDMPADVTCFTKT
jgi:hypothetical protein